MARRTIKRAFPVDHELRSYFTLRQAGGPSPTIDLTRDTSPTGESPPRWLVRICDVGKALHELPPHEFIAVGLRWHAVLEQEECQRMRDVCARGIARLESQLADEKMLWEEMRRRKDKGRAKESQRKISKLSKKLQDWRDHHLRAQILADEYREQRRSNEDLVAYQDGMTRLCELLDVAAVAV